MPRVLGGSYGGGRFLLGEVPLYGVLAFLGRLEEAAGSLEGGREEVQGYLAHKK